MLYYQHPIVEKLGELISVPVIDHGEVNGIGWAVTRFDKPETSYGPAYAMYNGYVLIPEGHPWRGTQTSGGPASYVHVHGGITFNREGVWGFDTGHGMDGVGEQYLWDQYSVRDEAKYLARQVAQHAAL